MANVTVTQIKAARALLEWNQADLAQAANVGLATIKRFETGMTPIPIVKAAIVRALEDAGIGFESNGKFVGVKLKARRRK